MNRIRLAILLIATAAVITAPFAFDNAIECAAIQLANLLVTWLVIWEER